MHHVPPELRSVWNLVQAKQWMDALAAAWSTTASWHYKSLDNVNVPLARRVPLARLVFLSCQQAVRQDLKETRRWVDGLLERPCSSGLLVFNDADERLIDDEIRDDRQRLLRVCLSGALIMAERASYLRGSDELAILLQERLLVTDPGSDFSLSFLRTLMEPMWPAGLGAEAVRASGAPVHLHGLLVKSVRRIERDPKTGRSFYTDHFEEEGYLGTLDMELVEQGSGDFYPTGQMALSFRDRQFQEAERNVKAALKALGVADRTLDVRWQVRDPGIKGTPVISQVNGNSLGALLTLGAAKLLGTEDPWKDLDLTGTTCSAAIGRDFSLRPVGKILVKLAKAARERGWPQIHAVGICQEQLGELGRALEGLAKKSDYILRDPKPPDRFVVVGGATLTELAERLNGLAENSLRRYRQDSLAAWRKSFRGENEPEETRPPYLESQTLEILELEESKRPWDHLSPERFRARRRDEKEPALSRLRPGEDDPWQAIRRDEFLSRLIEEPLESPQALRLVCVTHDAGQGKTELLKWLRKEIHARSNGLLAICAKVADLCQSLQLPTETQDYRDQLANFILSELGAKKEATEDFKRLISGGLVVFLLDGLDQAPQEVRTDLLAKVVAGDAALKCRFVIAGRPQAIWRHKDHLFAPEEDRCPWRFLQMNYFTPEQQERYLGTTVFHAIAPDAREILQIPRALFYLRELAAKGPEQLRHVRNAGGLYFESVTRLVHDGLRAINPQELGYREAMLLLAAIAFVMVEEGIRDQVLPGDVDVDDFKWNVCKRCFEYEEGLYATRADWLKRLDLLAGMGEAITCGLLEKGSAQEIQWRDPSLREFFAAFWLANYCREQDANGMRSRIYFPQEKQTEDYRWIWRFLAEMPRKGCSPKSWIRAMRAVYLPDAYSEWRRGLQGAPSWKRSTEIIYRSWETMEGWPEGKQVIGEFRREFQSILTDSRHPQNGIALALVRNFVRCPKDPEDDGKPFLMGSPETERMRGSSEALHEVVLDRFLMGKYAVTNEEFELFEPAHPETYRWGFKKEKDQEKRPVVLVSWYDAWVYSRWLGQEYRLPTEAEWEYACRAGSRTPWCCGCLDERDLLEYAWCYGELHDDKIHPVGQKKANRWGLYDLHGNVLEWCDDWYGEYKFENGSAVRNPTGPESGFFCVHRGFDFHESGFWRVYRGGSWRRHGYQSRSAWRFGGSPGSRDDDIGFRLALSAVGQRRDLTKQESESRRRGRVRAQRQGLGEPAKQE